jgi:hypothetical protein
MVSTVIVTVVTVMVPAVVVTVVPVVAPGTRLVAVRHPDRRAVEDTRRSVHHDRRRCIPDARRFAVHDAPVVIVGHGDTHHGTDETPDDGGIPAADCVTQYRTGTRTQQGSRQFVGSRGGVGPESGQTGHQQDRGYKFAIHDVSPLVDSDSRISARCSHGVSCR